MSKLYDMTIDGDRLIVEMIDGVKGEITKATEKRDLDRTFEGAAIQWALDKARENLRHVRLILDRPLGTPATASIEEIEEAIRNKSISDSIANMRDEDLEGYM